MERACSPSAPHVCEGAAQAIARMTIVPPLTFADAREMVIRQVRDSLPALRTEQVPLQAALGRVLAQAVIADRPLPPFSRSARDGFALRAADQPGPLTIIGEVQAGAVFDGSVEPGQAVEIMTGAPVPQGADSVVMIEFTTIEGDQVLLNREVRVDDNITAQGSECQEGELLLEPGIRLDPVHLSLMASVGVSEVIVYARPRVTILSTGDELVPITATPLPHQIRNSNSVALAAQVALAGGEAVVLPVAPDRLEETAELVKEGLEADLLLLSGGVSAGKYDVVERALAQHGAEFFFDRVAIQPGQPVVFGRARQTFFFGLPGNPISTIVCFAVFAKAALELLSGCGAPPLPLLESTLETDFHHRPGLTRFLPAQLSPDGFTVRPVAWSGSGDIAATARANAFLVADPNRPSYQAGERIQVMLR